MGIYVPKSFLVETKGEAGSLLKEALRSTEAKIACAKAHFAALCTKARVLFLLCDSFISDSIGLWKLIVFNYLCTNAKKKRTKTSFFEDQPATTLQVTTITLLLKNH